MHFGAKQLCQEKVGSESPSRISNCMRSELERSRVERMLLRARLGALRLGVSVLCVVVPIALGRDLQTEEKIMLNALLKRHVRMGSLVLIGGMVALVLAYLLVVMVDHARQLVRDPALDVAVDPLGVVHA